MSDRHLIHQLKELGAVSRAPALWRAQTRERLLKLVESKTDRPYVFAERAALLVQQLRLAVSPLRLAPVVAVLAIALVGYQPLARGVQAALPGQPLYSVKRASERVALSFKPSSLSHGLYYLELANRRLSESVAMGSSEPSTQGVLLRDYNISVGFAQASLEGGLPSGALAQAYDSTTVTLAANLSQLEVAPANRSAYAAAVEVTSRLSDRALALLVDAHVSGKNGLEPMAVALRLTNEISRLEAKLEGVDGKIKEFPASQPSPRVVIQSNATVVPAGEASRQAKESLNEAKELIANNEFSLALQKVQEGEAITQQTEEAVDQASEPAVEPEVKGDATEGEEITEPAAEGEPEAVEGEAAAPANNVVEEPGVAEPTVEENVK